MKGDFTHHNNTARTEDELGGSAAHPSARPERSSLSDILTQAFFITAGLLGSSAQASTVTSSLPNHEFHTLDDETGPRPEVDKISPYLRESISSYQSHLARLHALKIPVTIKDQVSVGKLSIPALGHTSTEEWVKNIPTRSVNLSFGRGVDPIHLLPPDAFYLLQVASPFYPSLDGVSLTVDRYLIAYEPVFDRGTKKETGTLVLIDALRPNHDILFSKEVTAGELSSKTLWNGIRDRITQNALDNPSSLSLLDGLSRSTSINNDTTPAINSAPLGVCSKDAVANINTWLKANNGVLSFHLFPNSVEVLNMAVPPIEPNRDFVVADLRTIGKTGIALDGLVRGIQVNILVDMKSGDPELREEIGHYLAGGNKKLYPPELDSYGNTIRIGYTLGADGSGIKSFVVTVPGWGLTPGNGDIFTELKLDLRAPKSRLLNNTDNNGPELPPWNGPDLTGSIALQSAHLLGPIGSTNVTLLTSQHVEPFVQTKTSQIEEIAYGVRVVTSLFGDTKPQYLYVANASDENSVVLPGSSDTVIANKGLLGAQYKLSQLGSHEALHLQVNNSKLHGDERLQRFFVDLIDRIDGSGHDFLSRIGEGRWYYQGTHGHNAKIDQMLGINAGGEALISTMNSVLIGYLANDQFPENATDIQTASAVDIFKKRANKESESFRRDLKAALSSIHTAMIDQNSIYPCEGYINLLSGCINIL